MPVSLIRRTRTAVPALLSAGLLLSLAMRGYPQSSPQVHNDPRVTSAVKKIELYAAKAGHGDEAVNDVYAMSQNAISHLAAVGRPAVPQIESVVDDPSEDAKVKAMMCEALGRINGPKSAALLTRVLRDQRQDQFVRAVAGHALAGLRRPESARALEAVVADPSVPMVIRSRTMMAIGAHGLDDVDWLKRAAVGDGIGLPPSTDAHITQQEGILMLNAQRALGASDDPRALDAILDLQSRYPTNAVLTDILKRKKNPRSILVLLRVLTYKNPKGFTSDAMIVAAEALGEMKAERAVEPLIAIVEHDKNMVFVEWAARALAEIGDKRAIPPLRKVVAGAHNDPRFTKNDLDERISWSTIADLKRSLNRLERE